MIKYITMHYNIIMTRALVFFLFTSADSRVAWFYCRRRHRHRGCSHYLYCYFSFARGRRSSSDVDLIYAAISHTHSYTCMIRLLPGFRTSVHYWTYYLLHDVAHTNILPVSITSTVLDPYVYELHWPTVQWTHINILY